MIKLLVIISLYASLSMVSSQNCSNTTSARRQFGFDNSVTTPISGSGFQYCNSLKTGTSCCTAATVNGFQDKAKVLLANLTANVIRRDQYYAAAANNAIGKLQTASTNFQGTINTFAAIPSGTNANPTLTQPLIAAILDALKASADLLVTVYTTIPPNYGTLGDFQSARTACVKKMVDLQTAVWCLACDPNAASKGYNPTTNTLPLSDYTCNRLTSYCYQFVSNSMLQTIPISMKDLVDTMAYFTTLVNRIRDGTAEGVNAFDYTSTNPQTADVPDSCVSATNCNFVCTTLFSNGVINQDNLVAGGDVSGNGSRILRQDDLRMLTDRELQSGTFRPADDESGVTVTFEDDPGNVNGSKSGALSFGSVLIGAIVLLSSYLL